MCREVLSEFEVNLRDAARRWTLNTAMLRLRCCVAQDEFVFEGSVGALFVDKAPRALIKAAAVDALRRADCARNAISPTALPASMPPKHHECWGSYLRG
jgi:hypothetical protein